jgi:hypothetical protein
MGQAMLRVNHAINSALRDGVRTLVKLGHKCRAVRRSRIAAGIATTVPELPPPLMMRLVARKLVQAAKTTGSPGIRRVEAATAHAQERGKTVLFCTVCKEMRVLCGFSRGFNGRGGTGKILLTRGSVNCF